MKIGDADPNERERTRTKRLNVAGTIRHVFRRLLLPGRLDVACSCGRRRPARCLGAQLSQQ